MLSPRFFVIHDAGRSCEDEVSELTRRQELDDPLLEVLQLDVEAWADDAGLVEAGHSLICVTFVGASGGL